MLRPQTVPRPRPDRHAAAPRGGARPGVRLRHPERVQRPGARQEEADQAAAGHREHRQRSQHR